jgi:membrane-anchored protein YejM (alkaline phosphatase superfamily)
VPTSRAFLARAFDAARIGPVGLLLAGNVVACLVLLAWQSGPLLTHVLLHPLLADRARFLAYVALVLASAALASFALLSVATLVVPEAIARYFAALACGVTFVLALADAKLYLFLGLHLYDRLVLQALRQSDLEGTLHASRGEIALSLAIVAATGVVEAAAAHASRRLWASFDGEKQRRLIVAGCLGGLGLAVGAGVGSRDLLRPSEETASAIVPVLPLHAALFDRPRRPHLAAHDTAGVDYPKTSSRTLARKLDVLFVAVESLRSDVVTSERMPNVARFMAQSQCVRTSHHHTGGTATQLGIFSLLYGLDAYYYEPFSNADVPSYPLGVLRSNGYVVEGGASSHIASWGTMSLMTSQLRPYYQPDGADPSVRDANLESWAEGELAKRDPNRPLFLFLFFDATHYNYYYPREFEHGSLPIAPEMNLVFTSVDDPALRKGLRERYESSLTYVDSLFGRLIGRLADEWRKGELVVILTGDHGEELWDEGLWGHVGRFLKSRTQVPLLFCVPGVEAASVQLSSHADVMPTLLDALAPSPALDPATYSSGVSLLAPEPADRAVVVSEQGLGVWNDKLQLITRAHKFELRQKDSDGHGRHEYALVSTRGSEDERAVDEQDARRDLDAHVPGFDTSFGSFLAGGSDAEARR